MTGIGEQLINRNVQRFRGGLISKAHRLCVSLNYRLESNEEEEEDGVVPWVQGVIGLGETLNRHDPEAQAARHLVCGLWFIVYGLWFVIQS